MISRLEGELIAVAPGRVELRCAHIAYELLVPACDVQRLATMIGETVEFHTLHYLEGQGQGASYLPRLIGFASPDDRAFFELFTTVKGLGNRKALRALELPFTDIAAAIASRDADLLVSLPEIGKRTAETIIVELSGKVDRFVEVKHVRNGTTEVQGATAALIRDAVGVLVQLGEAKLTARHLVERALAADPQLNSPDQVVAAAFRLKELA
ncbi:MAG TPA: helix-hairpin-helix domain-containing protein [Phycisphaerales bacterium]|nr:helix-hairpin-helix domain-containing protein [Phycisphaerales bacterium]HRQ76859.1 helix-hairpin-helix domain-containing protein [Phycisphaerales bacterium]